MPQIITTEQTPIKLWANSIEEGALEQARNIANLPFTFRHVAIMPDCHEGYGMPIGGVLATRNTVIPNAVGVDIGCGMCALPTSLTHIDGKKLKQIMQGIRQRIPLGFKHHRKKQDESRMPSANNLAPGGIVEQEYDAALKQIGTLGGGNHFIEIQKGSDGRIWIMIHSGSRNIGLKVASHYNKLAGKLNECWHTRVNPKWQLAFLPTDSNEAQKYMKEMQFCIDFAFANRKLMMDRIREVFHDTISHEFSESDMINIAHNYAQAENHFNTDVVVHRKGATSARKGELGIIPGSQGTASYIVQGKGNSESFHSCSHGAGRIMGRKQAQRELSLDTEKKKLDSLGIIHAIRSKGDLDEAPGAYKNIDTVMQNQEDLVDIQVKLLPLAVIKG